MKLIILLVIIVIIILLFKNIETFQSNDYVKIGDHIIDMTNDDMFVLSASDINWENDNIDAELGNNINIDLIYNNNTIKMNSSGSINRYYNSNLLNLYSKDNELKQIIVNKSKSYFLNFTSNILFLNDYIGDTYYYPMSYPRIPYRHNEYHQYQHQLSHQPHQHTFKKSH